MHVVGGKVEQLRYIPVFINKLRVINLKKHFAIDLEIDPNLRTSKLYKGCIGSCTFHIFLQSKKGA